MDRQHALLACGNERGVLSVYDVDEATFSIQLKRHLLVPTIVIDTKRSISHIVWNPRLGHEDELLLMFHFSCEAWLYNLSKLPEEAGYLRIFSPKTVRTGGGTAGLFWTSSSSTLSTGSSQLLMVGGSNGYVRCWRIRASPSAAPEALWSMRVTQTVSDVPVVFLYQWPDTSHLMAINALGMVAIWDIDRTEAVAFSSTGREPALIYAFDFFPLIVPYLVSPSTSTSQSVDYASHVQQVLPVPRTMDAARDDSQGARQFTLLFQSGLLCTIDLDRQRVIDIVARYQATRGGGSNTTTAAAAAAVPPIGGRSNESMTLHIDALTGHEGNAAAGAGAAGAGKQHPSQQQLRRREMAARAMAQDEALRVAAADAAARHTNNVWRADMSLSSSYRRTHTQILDARPTAGPAAFAASASASAAAVAATASVTTTTTTTATATSAAPAVAPAAVDEDLQRMQSIFQRNATRPAAATLPSTSAGPKPPVGQSTQATKPAQKSLFALTRPAGPAAKSQAPASATAPPPPPASRPSTSSTAVRSMMTATATPSSSASSRTAAAPAASAPVSLSAVLAGQKRKRDTASLGSSSAAAAAGPVPPKPPSASSASSASSVGAWRSLLSAPTQTAAAASTAARSISSSGKKN
eukprot:gene3366-2489_t